MRPRVSVCGAVILGAALVAALPPPAGLARTTPIARARVDAPAAATDDAGTFVSTDPARLLDTRKNLGGRTPGAGGTVHLQVSGRGGVPDSGVSAVVLNVTAAAAGAPGFVTVYADGGARPRASNLNLVLGRTVSNLVIAPVNPVTGKVALYNGSTAATALVADVSGYYKAGTPTLAGAFTSLTPARILDTRTNEGGSTPKSRETVTLQVTGKGGVPTSGVSAVMLNVTVSRPTGTGFVAVYPNGQQRRRASNLNFVRGQTVANMVVAPVGDGGKIDIYNGGAGSTALIGDVAGYFMGGTATAAGTFRVLPPTRLLDTRHPTGVFRPAGREDASVAVNGSDTGGRIDVYPSNTSAVVMNLTVTNATAGGFLEAWRAENGVARPPASNVNFVAGRTASNLAFVPVNSAGDATLFNGSTAPVDLLADVAGYYNLGTAGSVSGTVTNASDGTPVAGDQVVVSNGVDFKGTYTDQHGRYEVANLAAKDYSVRVAVPPDNQTTGSTKSATVHVGLATTVDFALLPAGSISGTVTAAGVDRDHGIFRPVDVFDADGDVVATTSPDADFGTYSVHSLAPGTYRVCFEGATMNDPDTTYEPQCYNDTPWSGTGGPPPGARAVTVLARTTQSRIGATLKTNAKPIGAGDGNRTRTVSLGS